MIVFQSMLFYHLSTLSANHAEFLVAPAFQKVARIASLWSHVFILIEPNRLTIFYSEIQDP